MGIRKGKAIGTAVLCVHRKLTARQDRRSRRRLQRAAGDGWPRLAPKSG